MQAFDRQRNKLIQHVAGVGPIKNLATLFMRRQCESLCGMHFPFSLHLRFRVVLQRTLHSRDARCSASPSATCTRGRSNRLALAADVCVVEQAQCRPQVSVALTAVADLSPNG